jgi:hypothetical protein
VVAPTARGGTVSTESSKLRVLLDELQAARKATEYNHTRAKLAGQDLNERYFGGRIDGVGLAITLVEVLLPPDETS